MRGEHVERALQVPQVARVRDDAGHRRAHEIPVAVVLLVGHPVAALTEPAQVGREHDVALAREHVRVRRAFVVLLVGDAADARLPRTVPVDREQRGPGLDPIVRDEEIRGNRHGRLGVEHDALAPVRTTVNGLGDFELEGHRLGRRPEHRNETLAYARPPRLDFRRVVERARIGVDARLVKESPVGPVGEIAPAGHEASGLRVHTAPRAHCRPPARCRKYAGVSHAPGK